MRLSEKSRLAVRKSESETESSETLKSEVLSDKKPPETSTEKYGEEIKIDETEEKQIKIATDKNFEKVDDQKIEGSITENSLGRMSLLGLYITS